MTFNYEVVSTQYNIICSHYLEDGHMNSRNMTVITLY
jgi:hypothetical protein